MQSITFTGIVKDYESKWYYGFYRVKPTDKIQNPRAAAGTSNALVYLINKSVEAILKINWNDVIGRTVRVTGHWFPKFDKFFFEVENIEMI